MRAISFLHTADLHLGEPIKGWKWEKEQVWKREQEHLETFHRIIRLVESRAIPFLFIAGDFLEHGYVTSSLFQYVLDQLERIPNTQVFISPGNHDPYRFDSIYLQKQWPEHVHIFGPKWEELVFPEYDLRLCGRGFADFTERDASLPNPQSETRYHIYLMHGDYNQGDSVYFPIGEADLLTHHVDYVGLGHIHKRATYYLGEDKQTTVHYPGSPEAHNWKELGARTVTVGSLDDRGVTLEHVPIQTRAYEILEVDVTKFTRQSEITQFIQNQLDSILATSYGLIQLTGRCSFKLDDSNWFRAIERDIVSSYKWVSVEDQTIPDYDLDSLRAQGQLIGNFIDLLEEKMSNEHDPERRKVYQMALYRGLDAFWKVKTSL